MEDPIESELAEAKRAADEIVETVLPWIEMAVADESDWQLRPVVERLRVAAQEAVDHYRQIGEPIPAHLAVLRNPISEPSERNNQSVPLGPGAVRLQDLDNREVVRCKSCDWVQFRSSKDECTRCGARFEVEPAKSGVSPVTNSSGNHLWESSESEGVFLEQNDLATLDPSQIASSLESTLNNFVNISPELLDAIARKGTAR